MSDDETITVPDTPESLVDIPARWERDADTAGLIDRGDKAYVAMLAARCVELSGSGVSVNSDTYGKVSAGRFAERSAITINSVKAYLRTWDAMATAGLVPSRTGMSPGDDDVADLPDRETWNAYYRKANAPKPKR